MIIKIARHNQEVEMSPTGVLEDLNILGMTFIMKHNASIWNGGEETVVLYIGTKGLKVVVDEGAAGAPGGIRNKLPDLWRWRFGRG